MHFIHQFFFGSFEYFTKNHKGDIKGQQCFFKVLTLKTITLKDFWWRKIFIDNLKHIE